MGKKGVIWIVWIVLSLLSLSSVIAEVTYYFSDQMNFQPGESREHVHEITFTGNLTVEPPAGFVISNYTNGITLNGDNMTWESNVSKTVNFTLASVSNCTEGDFYESKIYADDVFLDEFTYVCIPDNKIVDFKVEYGHGCGNYLANDELYISNESIILFNLIRVWNIGQYLTPNEDATDASIDCVFERNYTVRTYGRTNLTYSIDGIASRFFWDLIEGGYWFRLGVVSQDVKDKAVGDYYNVSCGNLTYRYEHQQVQAGFSDYGLEVRTIKPFTVTVTNISSTRVKYTIENTEEYPVYSIYFSRIVDGYTKTEEIPVIEPGEKVYYEADRTGDYNTTIFFVPSWQRNCWTPETYTQSYEYTGEQVYCTVEGMLDSSTNSSIFLNWTDASADSYRIYYDENLTRLLTMDPNYEEANVSGITNTYYTDSSDTYKRVLYYRVSAVSGGTETLCEGVLCKCGYEFIASDNDVYTLNWFALGCNVSENAETFLERFPGQFDTAITALNRSNPNQELYFSHVKGLASNIYSLRLGSGYEVSIKENYNHTIVGSAILEFINLTYVASDDDVRTLNWIGVPYVPSPKNAETFLANVPGDFDTAITTLNRSNPNQELYFSHVKNLTSNIYDITRIDGYEVSIKENFNHTITD